MPPDDDGELMSRLQAGEERALDQLMNRWQEPLRRFLFRTLRNEADALDLAQESFVRVYLHRAKFQTGAKFSTWLFSIALNLARDRLRRLKTRASTVFDEASLSQISERSDHRPEGSPEEALARKELADTVRDAVAALPEPLKAAVLLCEFEDMSQADAAAVVGCTAKAVETRLYRARALLKNALAAYW